LGLVLAFLPVLYGSAFLHELGHALMGRATGFVVTSFGLGTRRPWCVIPVGGAQVFFCPIRPFQGITFAFASQFNPSRGRLALYLAGGILAHGLLAVLALAMLAWLPWGGCVWLAATVVNGAMAMANLMTFKIKVGKATSGHGREAARGV
jgi:membrane-associated protease RseP (regulator of RpoE activity)